MKSFDFECPDGHKVNDLFRESEEIPDEIPCDECAKSGKAAVMTRIRIYAVPGVMLPSSPGSYNQGH